MHALANNGRLTAQKGHGALGLVRKKIRNTENDEAIIK
jgi:hypothetical protein